MKKISYFLFILFVTVLLSENTQAQSSLYFDGDNDYVSIQNNAALQATSAITIEAWINATSWQNLMYKGSVISNSNNTGGDNGFDIRAAENGKLELNLGIGGSWATVTTPAIMELGVWYHIAAVYNGSTMKLYINGIERASVTQTGTISNFAGNLFFGECPGWNGRKFNGKIDEVRIWNIARTATEIVNTINADLTGNETGLAGYWKLNEGTGTTTADATANENNGTLMGMNQDSWVENYECILTEPDAGISGINAPVSDYDLSNNEQLTVAVSNFSLLSASNFQIKYTVNGGAEIVETFTGTLSGLSTENFTFAQAIDMSAVGNYEIVVTTNLANDINQDNNSFAATIVHFDENANFSLDFDGSNDKVIIPHNDILCPTTALTVEAWINANQWKPQAWAGTIVGKDGDENDGASGYVLRCGANGTAQFVVTAPGWNEASSAPVMQAGSW